MPQPCGDLRGRISYSSLTNCDVRLAVLGGVGGKFFSGSPGAVECCSPPGWVQLGRGESTKVKTETERLKSESGIVWFFFISFPVRIFWHLSFSLLGLPFLSVVLYCSSPPLPKESSLLHKPLCPSTHCLMLLVKFSSFFFFSGKSSTYDREIAINC